MQYIGLSLRERSIADLIKLGIQARLVQQMSDVTLIRLLEDVMEHAHIGGEPSNAGKITTWQQIYADQIFEIIKSNGSFLFKLVCLKCKKPDVTVSSVGPLDTAVCSKCRV